VSKQLRHSNNCALASTSEVSGLIGGGLFNFDHPQVKVAEAALNHARQIERQSGASGCAGVLGITSQRQKLYWKQCPSQVDLLGDLSNSHVLRKMLDWLDSCSSSA
jgi:hypothetical protein